MSHQANTPYIIVRAEAARHQSLPVPRDAGKKNHHSPSLPFNDIDASKSQQGEVGVADTSRFLCRGDGLVNQFSGAQVEGLIISARCLPHGNCTWLLPFFQQIVGLVRHSHASPNIDCISSYRLCIGGVGAIAPIRSANCSFIVICHGVAEASIVKTRKEHCVYRLTIRCSPAILCYVSKKPGAPRERSERIAAARMHQS